MESQVELKKMYAYFTEVNKKVNLIQWEYKDLSRWRAIGNTETGASTGSQGGTAMPEAPMVTSPETITPENKVFTLMELQQYDGTNGKPAYVAVDGVVYDVSTQAKWAGGRHFGVKAGTDGSEYYHRCHGLTNVVSKLKKVGVLQK